MAKNMTSYVLTLVGNARSAPLEGADVKRVWQQLGASGELDWLAENEACDLLFESSHSAPELTLRASLALKECAIDVVCTSNAGRRKKLLISDMDSTVIDQECIDELGDAIGQGGQIRKITAAVVNGEMSFSDALRKRMVLMKGMELSLLEKIYNERISVKKGARTLVQTMRKSGAYCILVSGGFSFFTRRIAQAIGFHDHQGNELMFEAGKLTGAVKEPILGRDAKLRTLKGLCEEKGLTLCQVLAVGDGANDIEIIKAAGLGVAFHGSPALHEQANATIHYRDLTSLLYIQGFRKSEFVLSRVSTSIALPRGAGHRQVEPRNRTNEKQKN